MFSLLFNLSRQEKDTKTHMSFVQNLFSPTSTPNTTNGSRSPKNSSTTSGGGGGGGISSQLSSFLPPSTSLSFDSNQMRNGSFNMDATTATANQRQPPQPAPLSPSLYPEGHPLAKSKLTPFSTRIISSSLQKSSRDVSSAGEQDQSKSPEETKKWLEQMPTFSQEKRFRPSDTWAAISPNFPNLADVFPEQARKREKYLEEQRQSLAEEKRRQKAKDEFFSDFAFTGEDFEKSDENGKGGSAMNKRGFVIPSATKSTASGAFTAAALSMGQLDEGDRSHRGNDEDDAGNNHVPTNAIEFYRSLSQQRQHDQYRRKQQHDFLVQPGESFTNGSSVNLLQSQLAACGVNSTASFGNQSQLQQQQQHQQPNYLQLPPTTAEEVEDFRLRSASMVTAVAAARLRSFTGGSDFDNNPFATRVHSPSSSSRNQNNNNSNNSPKKPLIKSRAELASTPVYSSTPQAVVARGTVSASIMNNKKNQQQQQSENGGDSNLKNNSDLYLQQEDDNFQPRFDEFEESFVGPDVDAYGVPKENPWIRNVLMSLGSTANPQSQRLFDELAPERLAKERQQIAAETLQRQVPKFNAKAKIRGANNLLPPTPFSQTVPVLKGSFPNWIRRCEPARDLDAPMISRAQKKANAKSSSSASDEEDDSSDDDDEAIFDEFLLKEKEDAKNEKPRTERRGDFYRLSLHAGDQNGGLKIYEHAPVQQKDPNEAALEFLAVSRPEFAPALRRLAPWQLKLIDWSSLFSGGTHQEVSVTAKRFPAGAAWDQSPFSEAPTSSGSLGFVGNLKKREKESEFFSKLHGSNDGRVDEAKLKSWINRQPIRFKVTDDPV